ncbi:biogenesis of lysosome-related organelles complex 1 subunit 5 [Notothenia coriiceps]|uniref:Biogenesis of lysosome-related organelles complex 1 subunit 5 n=1 Tax=Notothenia coriiceps TaxID=8208 RepID=A0A6I9NNQ7_9TELE|nr:PREDICTED: biogenesis of lysosome-related organelles complex 1 subunit 5 [Notothenia coriiceps]
MAGDVTRHSRIGLQVDPAGHARSPRSRKADAGMASNIPSHSAGNFSRRIGVTSVVPRDREPEAVQWRCEREKRGHRESRLLENLNKIVTETNEQMLPTDLEGMLSNVFTRLDAANHMAERVQQRELEAQQSTQLQGSMERLKEEWAEFLKEQQRLKEEVDEEHAKAVGQLSTTYNEKKKDLTKFSPL